jgi:hypothetical protein
MSFQPWPSISTSPSRRPLHPASTSDKSCASPSSARVAPLHDRGGRVPQPAAVPRSPVLSTRSRLWWPGRRQFVEGRSLPRSYCLLTKPQSPAAV